MTLHALVVAVAAGLLAYAGAAKLRAPESTSGALAATGLPSRRGVVYTLGSIEIAIAVAALVVGSRLALVVLAATYVGFAVFVAQALWRRLPIQSCGCLGQIDLAPHPVHVVFNAGMAGAALSLGAPGPLLGGSGWMAIAALGVAAGLAQLLIVGVSEVPSWRAAMRGHR